MLIAYASEATSKIRMNVVVSLEIVKRDAASHKGRVVEYISNMGFWPADYQETQLKSMSCQIIADEGQYTALHIIACTHRDHRRSRA